MTMYEKTTVLILLDAFRWDYLSEQDTPTLWAMAQAGIYVHKLTPNLGFCERSEIFTGTRPDLNGNFTAITYDPQAAPLADMRHLFRLLSPLDRALKGRYIRRVLGAYLGLRGRAFPMYRIPLSVLPLLSLTEDKRDHSQAGGFAVESVLDVMLREGKRFYYGAFTALGMRNGDDMARQRDLLQRAGEGWNLYLLYVGATDSLVHECGAESPERRRVCREADQYIAELVRRFQDCYRQVDFLVFGDHGMIDVECCLDIGHELDAINQKYHLAHGRDYRLFLDSTMARFWALKPGVLAPVADLLQTQPFVERGQVLTSAMGQAYHVPAPSVEYGELIWWAKPGTLIFPDYFHNSKPVRAMHGYDPADDRSKSMAVVYTMGGVKREWQTARLLDVCPTLCDLVQVPYPASNMGQSLLSAAQGLDAA